MDTTNLIAYLPFDESATQDLCGNEWTAYGTTSIGETNAISGNALQLNKGYLRSNSAITFGGADFTVSFYAYVSSNSEYWTAPFSAVSSLSNARSGQIVLRRNNTNTYFNTEIYNSSGQSLGSVQVDNLTNALHHFEYDYSHADSKFRIFIDGALKATQSCSIERLARYIFLGTNNCNQNSQRMVGSIDEFLLYDGVALHTQNFTPPTDEDYIQLKLSQGLSVPFYLEADMERVITNATWNPLSNVLVWLPFDESTTQDLCGNEWTAYGTTSIDVTNAISSTALQLNKGYLRSNSAITFGGADFTISFYAYVDSASEIWATPFSAEASLGYDGRVGQITLRRYQTSNDFSTEIYNSNRRSLGSVSVNNLIGARHHFEYDYCHDDSTFKIFIGGELRATQACSLERLARYIFLGTNNCRPNNYRMVGSIDEFLLYDGVALHTQNFTPPTDEDYIALKLAFGGSVAMTFNFDAERKLKNNVEISFDTLRKILHGLNLVADSQRQIFHSVELINDFERILSNNITFDVQLSADFQRKLKNNVQVSFDSQRQIVRNVNLVADSQRQILHGVNLIADSQRQVVKSVDLITDVERFFIWRYENPGTADSLIISGTTLTGLSIDKSVTGTAFYQTQRLKCFDLPASNEIWIKFDVYFNGSQRWRAFNGGDNSYAYNAGVTVQTNGALSLVQNSAVIQNTAGICKKNQLQTVLLHMISGSTDGVIEAWVDGSKIYTYTGDVNHGEDFADIYLQSDGAGTFFSNVIISNVEIKLGEGWHASNSDVEQKNINVAELNADLERIIIMQGVFEFLFDSEVNVLRSLDLIADANRTVQRSLDLNCDIEVFEAIPVEVVDDVARFLRANIILFPIDNSQYFPSQTPALRAPMLRADSAPVVIPSQARPFQANNTQGIQSFEVLLEEHQLSAQVKFTSVIQLEPLQAISGQFLDYSFATFVDNTRQEGILYTCDCCSNVDELLYSQLNYSVEEDASKYLFDFRTNKFSTYSGPNYYSGDSDDETADDTAEEEKHTKIVKKATALTHLQEIVKQLFNGDVNALEPHFTDFVSNLDVEQKDVSFSDLISSLFGWSSRIPNKQINIFARVVDGKEKLFVIERGQEPFTIDISNSKHSTPVIEKSIVRTFVGSSPDSSYTMNIQLPGELFYPPPPSVSSDGRTFYDYINVSGYNDIEHGYALKQSRTYNYDGTRHVVTYTYDTVQGVYTCTSETAITYDIDNSVIDKKKTVHHRLSPSQQFSRMDDEDGNALGSNVSSNLPGFYNEKITLIEPATVTKLITIPGNPLVDMSFPFIDPEDFERVSSDLIALNRSIQETVSFTIYDFPHLINFLDRIYFDGNEYFLISNSALSSHNIFCQQSIVMRRWYSNGS